jgi:site-specific DNA recombinase
MAGLRCAVYARKSTEQRGECDAERELKSVSRQVDSARAFIAGQGWALDESHIYIDDAVSGQESEKLKGRDRLFGAIEQARRPFDVLVIWELSRLSRDDEELPGLVRDLREAGVRLFCEQDKQEVLTENAFQRGMVTMKSVFVSAEAEAASTRTRAGMIRRTQAGHWVGGNVFGYDRIRVGDRKDGYTELHVNAAQAAIVRYIFDLSAQGVGIHRTAHRLSAEYPALRKWSAQGIQALLTNELYIGKIVFGRTMWVKRRNKATGKVKKKKVTQPDTSKIVTIDNATLRIVSPELWEQAQARKAETFKTYLRQQDGRLSGKPEQSRLASEYLLSGMLACADCGGSLIVSRIRGGKYLYYLCSRNRARGPAGCLNNSSLPADKIHGAVVTSLKDHILTPERIQAVLADLAMAAAGQPEQIQAEREARKRELQVLDQQLANLTRAVGEGGPVKTLVAAIADTERKQDAIRSRLQDLEGREKAAVAWDDSEYRARVSALLTDWRAALEGTPVLARQILRKVVVGPITVSAREGRFGWLLHGAFGQIISGGIGDEIWAISGGQRRPGNPNADINLGSELLRLAQVAGVQPGTARLLSPAGCSGSGELTRI